MKTVDSKRFQRFLNFKGMIEGMNLYINRKLLFSSKKVVELIVDNE
jgi:hypothetical protein